MRSALSRPDCYLCSETISVQGLSLLVDPRCRPVHGMAPRNFLPYRGEITEVFVLEVRRADSQRALRPLCFLRRTPIWENVSDKLSSLLVKLVR